MREPDFDWNQSPPGLPPALAEGLLLGGVGQPHLTELARIALGDPATVRLGLDLLLAAWEAGPLNGGLARTLSGLDDRAAFLPQAIRSVVDAAARSWREPPPESPVHGLLASLSAARAHGDLLCLLQDGLRADPGNLFWMRHLLDLSFLLADWEAIREVMSSPWPEGLAPVRDKLLADALFQQGDFQGAAALYAPVRLLRPAGQRLGECLYRTGQPDRAAAEWRKALARSPWNVNALLRLYDRLTGLDQLGGPQPGPALPGPAVICLYTSGKASLLQDTLSALFASNLEGVQVVVLDNGSPDATPEVLSAWKDRAGDKLATIRLPVNVGAPAARNWLMRSRQAAESAFTAFLDDDALVPPDWASRFARAVETYPEAWVYGCKVVDLDFPGRIQSADVSLLDDAGGEPAFSSLCTQDLDYGQFDHIRPALSVTGCLHLFRTEKLRQCGDFDIRFSPTQYDDLDHDLRMSAQGGQAVYQGHLTVRHARLSGALLNQDARATGNSRGNLMKLAAKHPSEARQAMRERTAGTALRDVLAKYARVSGSPGRERA